MKRTFRTLGIFMILLVSFLTACKSPYKVQYGGRSYYRLEENEFRVDLTKAKITAFEECCYVEGLEMALNRGFEGSKFDSYVSIIFKAVTPDLEAAQKADSSLRIMDSKTMGDGKTTYHVWLIEKNGHYLCRVAFMELHTDLLLVWDIIRPEEKEARGYYEDEAYLLKKLRGEKI